MFLLLLFVLYSFQYANISNTQLRIFITFLLSFADTVTIMSYKFVSLIVRIILELALPVTLLTTDKTQQGCVAQWLATCVWKPKVPGLSSAANYVRR